MLNAAVFVFVGVDSNHFRNVRGFEVTVQGLVGDDNMTRFSVLGTGNPLLVLINTREKFIFLRSK